MIRDRIAAPLGLADTTIEVSDEQQDRCATGHSRRGRPVPDWQLPAMPGAGALRSTIDDLLRFTDAHLAPEATPLTGSLHLVIQPRVRAGRRLSVALGWHVLERKGAEWLLHNGGTGGFRSFVALDRACRRVAVLANDMRSVDRLGLNLLDNVTQLARRTADPA